MFKSSSLVPVFCCLSLLAGSAVAADKNDNWQSWATGDRFVVELSAFNAGTDTNLKWDDPTRPGLGVNINLEDVLDLSDSETVPLIFAAWRITERNSVSYSYVALDRSSKTTLDFELGTIGGIPFGFEIDSSLDIATHTLSYSYSFVFTEEYDFYAGAGLTYMDLDFSIKDLGGILGEYKESLQAPIPAIVVGLDWVFRPDWVWRNTGSFLVLKLGLGDGSDLEGSSFSISSTVEWRATDHLSVTGGLEYYTLDAENTERRDRYTLDYEFSGARLGVAWRF